MPRRGRLGRTLRAGSRGSGRPHQRAARTSCRYSGTTAAVLLVAVRNSSRTGGQPAVVAGGPREAAEVAGTGAGAVGVQATGDKGTLVAVAAAAGMGVDTAAAAAAAAA